MSIEPVVSGQWGSVVWVVTASNKVPARRFFLGLDKRYRAKVFAMFSTLAEVGWIKNRDRFKKLETRRGWALWEFKSFQVRFIGAFAPRIPRTFLIALGLKKKRDRHRIRDLDRAVKILEEHSIGIHVM